MQFRPIERNIEVSGRAIGFMTAGFRIRPSLGLRYLERFGLTRPGPDGKPALDPDGWYSQEAWLKCFEAVYAEIGPNTTFEIGRQLGGNYPIPPDLDGLAAAFRWLDLGFHFAHRKGGKPMCDPNTRAMTEGIGHYGCRVDGPRRIVSVCDNPYPCELDRGIEQGLASRFERAARVDHDAGECRSQGGARCTYVVTW
jgi:hypothetical protein